MQCFVFKPRRKGKVSALYSGRYRFDDMPAPVEVALHTADELVARKRLQDLITRKQREREGLAAPAPMRAALASTFADLVAEYALDLHAQGRVGQHVKDSTRRVLRLGRECKWHRIGDANAAAFTTWRARMASTMSAKMLKEYHVSAKAFFRWLVETERFDRNPLERIKNPSTKGREVRIRRAFTADEARRLVAVAEHRRLPYLTMLYTGLRYRAAWSLRKADYHPAANGGAGAFFEVPASKDKSKRRRIIPVHPLLAAELDAHLAESPKIGDGDRIFAGIFPRQRTDKQRPNSLRVDMAKAGIPVRDGIGRVIDYHSFRKTFNTWALAAGVSLRATQALMGHSTPDLTANAYTDETGLALGAQVARLEWIGADSAPVNDPPESGSGSAQAAEEISEALAAHYFAMVDATGLESEASFAVDILTKTLARIRAGRPPAMTARRRATKRARGIKR